MTARSGTVERWTLRNFTAEVHDFHIHQVHFLVESIDGKPTNLINSYGNNGVAHTFSIPTLGISVPLLGVDPAATNDCSPPAPCTFSSAHQIIKFSFMTPGPGQYPWQCFVPCGGGFLYGNGGPMSTVGYMDGFLKVVA